MNRYDDCGTTTESFKQMRDALNATGRAFYYSIHSPWTHGASKGGPDPEASGGIANMWRTTNDITNTFDAAMDRASVNDKYAKYAGPMHWNDPDMLEVGNKGVSDAEGRSHFALWCLMKAPLLIGTDLTTSSPATLATLGASGAIAINQDPLGVQGTMKISAANYTVWSGPLAHGCTAVLMINLASTATTATATFSQLGLASAAAVNVVDVWTGETVSSHKTGFVAFSVAAPHDCNFYKLCPLQ